VQICASFLLKEVGVELNLEKEWKKGICKACNNPDQLAIGKVLAVDPNILDLDRSTNRRSHKAKTKLGWECQYDLAALVKDMMQSDLSLMKKDQYLKEGGYGLG
jgi:GDPmannose 4,6-dehydratase